MNCWQVLGIKPTNNLKAIKKAYAAKSREVHPEEHPEEFRLLHDSYETALTLAKSSRFDVEETDAREERAATADLKKDTADSDDSADNDDLFAAVNSTEVREAADSSPRDESEPSDDMFKVVDKTKVPDTSGDFEKDDTESTGEPDIDFDEVLENADEEHAKKVIAATKAVMTSLEKAVSYPKEKDRQRAVENVVSSKFFEECYDIPYFVSALTNFVNVHHDLTDAFYGPVFMALHFDVLETREQKGIYEELYSIFTQRGKIGFNPQKNKFVKAEKGGAFGSIITIAVIAGIRAVARTNELPDWVYILFSVLVIGFIIFVIIRNKRLKAEQSPDTGKSFWNPKKRIRELRYFSKLAFAVDILALDFVFIWIMGEYYDSDLSLLITAVTAIVSILCLAYFILINTIIFIKSRSTHTKPWKPESPDDRKKANALFAIFAILDIILFAVAVVSL